MENQIDKLANLHYLKNQGKINEFEFEKQKEELFNAHKQINDKGFIKSFLSWLFIFFLIGSLITVGYYIHYRFLFNKNSSIVGSWKISPETGINENLIKLEFTANGEVIEIKPNLTKTDRYYFNGDNIYIGIIGEPLVFKFINKNTIETTLVYNYPNKIITVRMVRD